jgi:2-polyprenyl-6-methoxyphenol hydroxylase-like FAD-dependent oxidoreductase
MAQTSPLPLLISGGGIGGLAAAMVLAQDGHRVTLLEQAASFGEIGAGIQLGPNIFRMFDYLGLTEAINRVAFFPAGLGMNDVRTGEKIVRVPLGDMARATYGFPYGVIYRPASGLPGRLPRPAQCHPAHQHQGGVV